MTIQGKGCHVHSSEGDCISFSRCLLQSKAFGVEAPLCILLIVN